MHVVTSGNTFMDIDAYASSVALAELLRKQGEDAIAAGSAPLNASVTNSLRALNVQFKTDYKSSPGDIFTIVDLSDPIFFDLGATADNVVGIIDHHPGFYDYWKGQLGNQSRIELVGAACTQVYELWKEAELLDSMSKDTAKLLTCGILDNTLNLKANITTGRDKSAYDNLSRYAGLPEDWPEQYFSECQAGMLADIQQALTHDSKIVQYPMLTHETFVGQLALWDAKEFIHANRDAVRAILASKNLPWYMNLIDIHTGQSVFLCENPELKEWLSNLLGVQFDGNTATANRMWLRKEIMKQAIETTGQNRQA